MKSAICCLKEGAATLGLKGPMDLLMEEYKEIEKNLRYVDMY